MVSIPGSTQYWLGGTVSGLLGAVFFGLILTSKSSVTFLVEIPAMYGFRENILIGWILHLIHGMILGIGYAILVQDHQLSRYANNLAAGASIGFIYGLFLWAVLASTIMPAVVNVMSPTTILFPTINPWSLAGHITYGIILGISYPLIVNSL